MSSSKLIQYFSTYTAAFGFLASLPPDNFILTPASMRVDQSLSDIQTGIDVAAHATLDAEQLISHTRASMVDTFTFLWGLKGGVNMTSEGHELLTKIHDVLDNALSNGLATLLIF